MQIRKQKLHTSTTPIDYFTEGKLLHVLSVAGSGNQLIINQYSPDLEHVGSFSFHSHIGQMTTCCADTSSIFIPSTFEEILVFDHAGKHKVTIRANGMLLNMDTHDDSKYLYAVRGIPIMNKIKKDTRGYCVTANNKKSGEKIYQSRSISVSKHITGVSAKHGKLYLCADDNLYILSLDCQVEKVIEVGTHISFTPFVNDNWIVCTDNAGRMAIVDRQTLNVISTWNMQSGWSRPVLAHECLIWPIEKQIYRIECAEPRMKIAGKLSDKAGFASELCQGHVVGTTKESVFSFNLESEKIQHMPVDNGQMKKPLLIDKSLFMCSHDTIFKVIP